MWRYIAKKINKYLDIWSVDRIQQAVIRLNPESRYILFLPPGVLNDNELKLLSGSDALKGLKLVFMEADQFRLVEWGNEKT